MRRSAMVACAALAIGVPGGHSWAQEWKSVTTARQLTGEDHLELSIKYAAGRVELGRGHEDLLYRIVSRYDDRYFEFHHGYTRQADHGRLRIELTGEEGIGLGRLTDDDLDIKPGALEITLNPELPTSIDLQLGAVESDIDLGGLALTEIRLRTGASETRVHFSEPNRVTAEHCEFKAGAAALAVEGIGNSGCRSLSFTAGVGAMELEFSGAWPGAAEDGLDEIEVSLDIGLGAVELRVPADVGVRVERSTFLVRFDAPHFHERKGPWVSDNWERASRRISFDLTGALGAVELAHR